MTDVGGCEGHMTVVGGCRGNMNVAPHCATRSTISRKKIYNN